MTEEFCVVKADRRRVFVQVFVDPLFVPGSNEGHQRFPTPWAALVDTAMNNLLQQETTGRGNLENTGLSTLRCAFVLLSEHHDHRRQIDLERTKDWDKICTSFATEINGGRAAAIRRAKERAQLDEVRASGKRIPLNFAELLEDGRLVAALCRCENEGNCSGDVTTGYRTTEDFPRQRPHTHEEYRPPILCAKCWDKYFETHSNMGRILVPVQGAIDCFRRLCVVLLGQLTNPLRVPTIQLHVDMEIKAIANVFKEREITQGSHLEKVKELLEAPTVTLVCHLAFPYLYKEEKRYISQSTYSHSFIRFSSGWG
jgi:hypothetical protein